MEGLVLCGLSEEEHSLLDYFEDEEYVKETVAVQVSRQPHTVRSKGFLPQQVDVLEGDTAHASAYVFAQQTDALYGEWSIDEFLESDVLPGYVAMSADCRGEYLHLATNRPPDTRCVPSFATELDVSANYAR